MMTADAYAAVIATVAAGPSEAERAATREAMLRRRRHLFTLVEQPAPPAPTPVVLSIPPRQQAVSGTLLPRDLALLRHLRRHATPNAPLSLASVAEHLGLTPKQASDFVAAIRRRLVRMTDDEDARCILGVARRPSGYYVDEDFAARYPVVVAALEDER